MSRLQGCRQVQEQLASSRRQMPERRCELQSLGCEIDWQKQRQTPFNANSGVGFRPIVRNGQGFMLNSKKASPMIMTSLYDQLCLMKNLRKAFKKARKGKGTTCYVMEFQKDLEKNLLQLQKELRKQTYEPHPMKTFVICDPKSRVISASAFATAWFIMPFA